MNWIRDFVDLDGLDLVDLIHRFSLSTAEVENEIFFKGSDISSVVVAEIKSVEPHPESKKLHLLKVDIGENDLTDVVCGAPNVRVGMKTAFAKLGAKIGDITIEPRKLAGFTSNGMCCSEKEIGISDDNSGIMELSPSLKNGTDLKEIFEIDDIIFEVDNKSLTNRPDLWGHYGIAREFAALSGRKLRSVPQTDLSAYDSLPGVDLEILDPLCQRYSCLQIENITETKSPVNMRIRLYYCGMRAINLLADLTNYLMLEMGQPMHAFDSRKVEKIRVRRFEKPFVFKTLDGIERNCDENTLMICNGETPVAIAGIMGGYDSEIVDDTTTLTLESATFDAVSVRKTTVRLSHRTDASMRYEKCLDPEMTVPAIGRFLFLLREIDNGVKVVSRLTDAYPYHYEPVELKFDKSFIDKYTGIEISNDTVINTLTSLGFDAKVENDSFDVKVPSWRITKDVTMKADIIEEITRIYGYDNFDIHTASTPLYPIRAFTEKTTEEKVKDILVKRFSLHEVHSYIWAYHDEYKALSLEIEDNVRLVNATNPNIETLRRSIVPTQLCQVNVNTAYAPEFGLFEIGRVIDGQKENGDCNEKKMLCITLLSKTKTVKELYFKLRDMLAVCADDIKHSELSFSPKKAVHSYQHPKNLNTVLCGGKEIGEIGIVHPIVSAKIDKKAALVYAEIDMSLFSQLENNSISYREASRFPEMTIDLSFISDKFAPIKEAIDDAKCRLIRKVSVIDTFESEGIKSITVRLIFSHPERTLTGEEVKIVTDGIIEKLESLSIPLKN